MMGEHPERILPDETPIGIIEHHLAKYRFAIAQSLEPTLLDAACGVGYASAFVAEQTGIDVIGIDLSADAMQVAARDYLGTAPVAYAQTDATRLPFPGGAFGSVVGFETVEHLPDQAAYLSEVRRVLRPGGLFVCSTPYTPVTDPDPENPFHLLELSPADFEMLLRTTFEDVRLYTQVRVDTDRARTLRRLDVLGIRRLLPERLLATAGRLAGTPPTALRQANDFHVVPGVQQGTEVLAVCR